MKHKIKFAGILISAVLVISLFFFSFKNSETTIKQAALPPAPGGGDKFIVGCMESWYDVGINHNTNFDDLGLNITQQYLGTEQGFYPGDSNRHTPQGWFGNYNETHLFSNIPNNINDILGSMVNHNNSKFLWMRPKIEWLAYGQSRNVNSIFYLTKI